MSTCDLLHTCQHTASDILQASFLHLQGSLIWNTPLTCNLAACTCILCSSSPALDTGTACAACCSKHLCQGRRQWPHFAAATKHMLVLPTMQCTAQQVLSRRTTHCAFPVPTAAEDSRVWQSVYRTVQQVLLKGLADGAQEVRLAAVSAMTLLVPYTRDSSETNLFKQLVPAALKVLHS